jgi:ferritin-like protein
MFSKRLSSLQVTGLLPDDVSMLSARLDVTDVMDRFRQARITSTARRTQEILKAAEVMMARAEQAHGDPAAMNLASIGIGQAINGLRDEMQAQRNYLAVLPDHENGAVRMMKRLFAETFGKRLEATQALAQRFDEEAGKRESEVLAPTVAGQKGVLARVDSALPRKIDDEDESASMSRRRNQLFDVLDRLQLQMDELVNSSPSQGVETARAMEVPLAPDPENEDFQQIHRP